MEPLPQFLFQQSNSAIRIHKKKHNTFIIIKIINPLHHNRLIIKFIKILTFNIQKMVHTKKLRISIKKY